MIENGSGALAGFVRTVLGDVRPESLGPLDYHEHLFQRSPLLPGDELDDEERSGLEADSLFRAGTTAMVEATPTGLGRDPEAVARISRSTGLAVVHATGAHHAGHYDDSSAILAATEAELAALFTADVSTGFVLSSGTGAQDPDGHPIRAGLAKAGVRYWSIGSFERRVLNAVAETHGVTGAPVMVHLDFGSAAHEVLDILAAGGVPASSVVLAHIDRNLDPGLHLDLIARGAYLGYDGMARHREAPDSAILDCLATVVAGGGQHRVVLGGDVARASRYRAYGGMPGLDYLPVRFLPRLRRAVEAEAYDDLVHRNGARLLSFTVAAG